MPSTAYDRFYESFFGDPYMAWHDGLDVDSLLSLEGEEREKAEQVLLDALSTGDPRPAAGLGALRSQQSVPHLKVLLSEATGSTRVQTALALWQISEWPPAARVLMDELSNGDFWSTRADAASALAEVKTAKSVAALWAALSDPQDLVRSHAADSLLEMFGVESDPTDRDALPIRVMSEDESVRLKAIAGIGTLIGYNALH